MNEKTFIFKGIKLVTKAAFEAADYVKDSQVLYFVRTNETKDDGYLYLNGKKYGTGVDDMAAVSALIGEIPSGKTVSSWITDLATTIGADEVSHEATAEDVEAGKADKVGDKVVDTEATGIYATMDEKIEAAVEAAVDEINDVKVVDVVYTPKTTGENATNPMIQLELADGTLTDGFDASAFLIDGVLNNVELVDSKPGAEGEEATAGNFLKFTWNTDAGDKVLYVDAAKLVSVADDKTIEIKDGKLSAIMDVEDGVASNAALTTLDEEAVKTVTVNGKTPAATGNTAAITIDATDIEVKEDITVQTGATENDVKTVVASGDTIEDALGAIVDEIVDNEKVTAASLNDLNDKLDAINGTTVKVGEDVDGADGTMTADSTISDVLKNIYAKLGDAAKSANVTSTGKTITVTANEDGGKNVEVNREEATDDTVAAGHIALDKTADGALYGVMYFSGDDAEA